MKLGVLVNDVRGIGPKQTTLRLIDVAMRMGHEVLVSGVDDLTLDTAGALRLGVRALGPRDVTDSDDALVGRIASATPRQVASEALDGMLIRTNPGRDPGRAAHHMMMLRFLEVGRERGLRVVNDPVGLRKASSKLYVLDLPEHTRPRTLATGDAAEARAFLESLEGPGVIKPLQGSRGRDVFLVQSAQDPNLNALLDVLLRQGPLMAQAYVPEAVHGDTRVLVVGGELFEVNGQPGAFRRVPQRGEFRSNVDVGGATAPAEIDARTRQVVEDISPVLKRDGLFFVGIDLIGRQVIEVNAFSPGGTRAAKKFGGADFTSAFLEKLEAELLWASTPAPSSSERHDGHDDAAAGARPGPPPDRAGRCA